jgi:Fe2+ or Zn2+ uptake regulation protein
MTTVEKESVRSTKVKVEQQKFEDYLDAHGLKLTDGRRRVFRIVIETHGHFASEQVAKICANNQGEVSRATVYRCLRELLEAGIIRQTAFGEKHQLFEHVYDEKLHHHARCVRCGIVIEFPDLHEDNVYRPILEKQGFNILGHEMHFYGICMDCQD